jgi:outer membrane protein assembly factor BamA
MERLSIVFLVLASVIGFAKGASRGDVLIAFEQEQQAQDQERQRRCTTDSFEKAVGLSIRRVEFFGDEHVSDMVIRRRVLLMEGDPFTVENMRKSLEGINKLGVFYRVTEKDVEWCADERTHEVDFAFHFRERPRRRRK